MKKVILKAFVKVEDDYLKIMNFFRRIGSHYVPKARPGPQGVPGTFIEISHGDLVKYVEENLSQSGQVEFYLEHPEKGIKLYCRDSRGWSPKDAISNVEFILRNGCFDEGE